MATPKNPAKKKHKLYFEDCVGIATPTAYFQVQSALQELGFLLIDLTSGQVLTGQVNLPEIGVIDPQKQKKPIRELGFTASHITPKTFNPFDIDAILAYPSGPRPGELPLINIDVIDIKDTAHFGEVAHSICNLYAQKIQSRWVPTFIISIASLTHSDQGEQSVLREAVLRKYQGGSFTSAVSSDYLPVYDYFDDEDL